MERMANEATRILGLDPGLRRTGWGVVVAEGARLRWVAHGVVTPDDKAPFAQRLLPAAGDVTADAADALAVAIAHAHLRRIRALAA